MLMNKGGGLQQKAHTTTATSFASLSGMNMEGVSAYQEERERQASALAAAGMVAETVSLEGCSGVAAPPELQSSAPAVSTHSDVDNINWGAMDASGLQIDDMDLDFATLFDPNTEEANMHTEGSGWPVSGSATARSS